MVQQLLLLCCSLQLADALAPAARSPQQQQRPGVTPSLELHLLPELGGYEIHVNGHRWLRSGATGFHSAANGWMTVQDGSLKLSGNTTNEGSDRIGAFTVYSFRWSGAGGFLADTNFRIYHARELLTFEQVWVSGTPPGSSASNWDS